MSNKKISGILVVVVLVVVVASIGLFWKNAKLLFDESLYVEKNTYEYNLLISDSIKSMPVYKPVADTVRYHYGAGDGNKSQSDSIEYVTLETGAAILEFYKQHLASKGYVPQQDESVSEENIIYGNSLEDFNVYVRALEGKNQVIVYHQQIYE